MSKKKKEQKIALFGSLKVLVTAALLVALSIVFGKYLQIPVGEVMRFSLENLPIFIAGMAFGPAVGVAVGVAADLIGCVMMAYTVNPAVTLGAAIIGLCGGMLFFICRKMPLLPRTVISVTVPHILGSVVIKTVGLASYYNMPFFEVMLWRLLNYVIVAVLETALIYLLIKNNAIKRQLGMEN